MSVPLSQQITRYYDYYRDKEISFTKETLHFLRIDPRQIYIKCNGGQWPCIINSTSFQFARIIVGTTSGFAAEIKKKRDLPVSVRYCFIEQDTTPLSFFVNGRVSNVEPFKDSRELLVVTIEFAQQPPDDLILRLGRFIDTNENFSRRKEERIIINAESIRKLNMEKEETLISIAHVPRRCVLRDLSFGGAKILCMGLPRFLVNKEASLKITFVEPQISMNINGTVVYAENLEGRKDIVIANIEFDPESVPMAFKVQINEYITNNKMNLLQMNRARVAPAAPQQAAPQQTPAATQTPQA